MVRSRASLRGRIRARIGARAKRIARARTKERARTAAGAGGETLGAFALFYTHYVMTKDTIKMDESEEIRYQVRMPKELKNAFLRVAEARDETGAQAVRGMIREYIQEHKDALQRSVLDEIES